jgi:hypothetical protein
MRDFASDLKILIAKAWVGEKVVYPSIHVVCEHFEPGHNAAMGTKTLL